MEQGGVPLNEPPATHVVTVTHRTDDATVTQRLRPCSSADLAHLAPPRDEFSGTGRLILRHLFQGISFTFRARHLSETFCRLWQMTSQ